LSQVEEWRSKLVVDDLDFHTVLDGEKRPRPGQTDRHHAMMRGPPRSLSNRLSAKFAKPACLSIYLEEPWNQVKRSTGSSAL
jgi:hypothetical protein